MGERPYVLLSCGTSIDGCLDDARRSGCMLSNDADFDRVDATPGRLRRDPGRRPDGPPGQPAPARALPRTGGRSGWRRGVAETPAKVVRHRPRPPRPGRRVLHSGDGERLVYCRLAGLRHGPRAARRAGRPWSTRATPSTSGWSSRTSTSAGWGGSWSRAARRCTPSSSAQGLADELHLSVAPLFVGDSRAPRLLGAGRFPQDPGRGRCWPRSGRSATSCCCGTACRSGSTAAPPRSEARVLGPPAPADRTGHRHRPRQPGQRRRRRPAPPAARAGRSRRTPSTTAPGQARHEGADPERHRRR